MLMSWLSVVICSWAAILSWIRHGAAFVLRTPSRLTPFRPVSWMQTTRNSHPRTPLLHSWFGSDDDVGVVTNWDSDQDEVELSERMEEKSTAVDYKYWTVAPTDDNDLPPQSSKIDDRTDYRNKLEKPHRRRRRFGMPGGSGATSEGIRFSIPGVYEEENVVLGNSLYEEPQPQSQHDLSSKWYVTLGNSTGLPLNMSIAPKRAIVDKSATARAKAEAAFHVKETTLQHDNDTNAEKSTKLLRREERIRQLASLLNIPIASARSLIRRAPSLGSLNIQGTVSKRCIEMSLLLQCTPSKFTSIIRHCPSLLTFRVETIATKLIQLDGLLSGGHVQIEHDNVTESDSTHHAVSDGSIPITAGSQTRMVANPSADVSETTLSIARRVPQLLVSNIPSTLSKRAALLRSLFKLEKENGDQAFLRVLKRCPELLLYNIEATIVPKLDQLENLFSGQVRQSNNTRVGTDVALREPRLLLYDIEQSLTPKAHLWTARVNDQASFIALLARYPTLLMYSLGAAARLEYFQYRNGRKPDASEARQLLMLSKKAVQEWGQERGDCLFDSTPAILGGTISKRGRPRTGESALEASNRRDARRAAQSCLPHQLEELKVGELRKLLKEHGGTPSCKRKTQLISELHALGLTQSDDSQAFISSQEHGDVGETQSFLSYSQWIGLKLCTSYPQSLAFGEDLRKSQTAGDLEKLYGMALKCSIKAHSTTNLNRDLSNSHL